MSTANSLVVLDSNVVVAAIRDNPLWKKIDADHGLLARPERPILPVVCFGELLGLVRQFAWGPEKVLRLESLLGNLSIADIRSRQVLERYGEIRHFLRSRTTPQNDMWIAAIASVAKAHLITCDTHFDGLHGKFLERTYYNPEARY